MLFLYVTDVMIEFVAFIKFLLIATTEVILYQLDLLELIADWCFTIIELKFKFVVSDIIRFLKRT